MTGGPISTAEEACKYAGYYMRRRKTERFHCVLKSGRAIGKLQERSIGKTAALILMHSIIAVMVLNMMYTGRLKAEAPCSVLPGPDERKLLYCIAKKTKKEPSKPYSMKEAVDCLGWPGDRNALPAMGRRE
jgi:hypothetical protein